MDYSSLQLASLQLELTWHMASQCYLPPNRGDIPTEHPAEHAKQYFSACNISNAFMSN